MHFSTSDEKGLSYLPPDKALSSQRLRLMMNSVLTWYLQLYSHQQKHKSGFMVIYLFIF